jgi:inositol polyphosphate 5-phosphatase INPP5B/F
MTVSPTYGMLIPGEQPTTINVTITIDNTTAQLLNSGREVLDDILILRLENGRDYYITVKADFSRSCFGMTVDELVMYSDAIRNIPLDSVLRAEKYDINPTQALCVPKELWRIVDAIYAKGLQETDLFSALGDPEEVKQIRECVDAGTAFGSYSIHSYVDTFLAFLLCLASPLVPSSLFPTVEIDSLNIQSMTRRFLEDLPPIHYNVFVYIVSFFREALLYRETNKLTAAKLARTCCKYCSPAANTVILDTTSIQRRAGMQLIMLHLLETSSI